MNYQIQELKEEILNESKINTPEKIQEFLDSIPYSVEDIYRCPKRVFKDKVAHCFDGAVFAAAALLFVGYDPLIIELKAVNDDDHMLALYKRNGCWGAIGKSNFVGLRYREPIYRNLRELGLSYFEFYYNTIGEKTLRSYSKVLNLKDIGEDWLIKDEKMEDIANKIEKMRHYPLLTEVMIKALSPVDKRTYEAGMLGTDPRGLYKPKQLISEEGKST